VANTQSQTARFDAAESPFTSIVVSILLAAAAAGIAWFW